MAKYLSLVSLLVNDYDEAIDFYVQRLGFVLLENTPLNEAKRWVVVAPGEDSKSGILLAKAVGTEQLSCVGNQTGGRVFLFLNTDNFDEDYEILLKNDIKIIRPPKQEEYGRVAVFADLYGNLWDLIGK